MTLVVAPVDSNLGLSATVHGRVTLQAAAHPDALAVTCDGVSITYGELNARANQLAWRLQTLGVTQGKLVAIAMERSIDMIVGLLGILKSGGGYLPIDPAYPKERTGHMLADAAPVALLTTSSCQSSLPACDLPAS